MLFRIRTHFSDASAVTIIMLSSRLAFLSLVLGAVGFVNASPFANNASSIASPTGTSMAAKPTCTQPKLSDVPSEWTKTTVIDNKLPPISPAPVFWSGNYNGESVRSIAEGCTENIPGGAATIGMLMCSRKTPTFEFVMPKSPSTDGNALWAHASKVYAAKTKGKAFAVVGQASVTSIWFTDELPALRANKEVKSVISLDLKTCKEKCFWYCPNANDCKVCF